jgi:hypothetical protein
LLIRASHWIKSGDFSLSLCVVVCCRLLLFAAPKGQEKGNVYRREQRYPKPNAGEPMRPMLSAL